MSVCEPAVQCLLQRFLTVPPGNARIQGMGTDLELTGFRFNWALTIFYFTYIAYVTSSRMYKETTLTLLTASKFHQTSSSRQWDRASGFLSWSSLSA